jgi:hypothetical protein
MLWIYGCCVGGISQGSTSNTDLAMAGWRNGMCRYCGWNAGGRIVAGGKSSSLIALLERLGACDSRSWACEVT